MCFLELDFTFTFSFVLEEHETSKRKIKHYKFLLFLLHGSPILKLQHVKDELGGRDRISFKVCTVLEKQGKGESSGESASAIKYDCMG